MTISTTKDRFPYVDGKAPNELDHHFKSPIAIYLLRILRWALREPVILYKMYCQAWFDKNYFGRGRDGYSGKELSARLKVLVEVLCLILSVSQ